MARSHDHRRDEPYLRDLYRRFDLEDLVRISGWMREIKNERFAVEDVRAASSVMTGGHTWGRARVRRVLRVGVEMGWLVAAHGSYAVTGQAPATLPAIAVLLRQIQGDIPEDLDAPCTCVPHGPKHTRREHMQEMVRRAMRAGVT